MSSTQKYIGIQNIADYCGVERTAVYQWLYRHGPETRSETPVPTPSVSVVQGKDKDGDDKHTYGWAPSQLAAWRNWYAMLKGWSETEAAHYYVDVDAKLKEKERERSDRAAL